MSEFPSVPVGPTAVALTHLSNIEKLLREIKQEQADRFDQIVNYCRTLEAPPVDVAPQVVEVVEEPAKPLEPEYEPLLNTGGWGVIMTANTVEQYARGEFVFISGFLPSRIENALRKQGIKDLQELAQKNEWQLRRLVGIGEESIMRISGFLRRLNLHVKKAQLKAL